MRRKVDTDKIESCSISIKEKINSIQENRKKLFDCLQSLPNDF